MWNSSPSSFSPVRPSCGCVQRCWFCSSLSLSCVANVGKVTRIVNRASMKERLKLLARAVKHLERQAHEEYRRGFEMGGVAMRKAIEQAQAEQVVTKLDGDT